MANHSKQFNFTHYKLDAYRVSSELADLVMAVAQQVPKGQGHHKMVSQVVRAATGAEALIAEGANRYTTGQKRQRFTEARGECGEAGAAAEVLAVLGLVPVQEARVVHDLAGRESAILFGMERRYTR